MGSGQSSWAVVFSLDTPLSPSANFDPFIRRILLLFDVGNEKLA